jgi:3-dehydroquinate synthase
MIRIDIRTPSGSYPILIGLGLHAEVGALARDALGRERDAVVVTNPTVGAHYSKTVVDGLEISGFSTALAEVPDGERYKNLDTVRKLYSRFLEVNLQRDGVVVALGGGVVGDMAGFAAATYMRGIRFVQIPTSLLAMVDASVGGKTGVDLPEGKNLVGAFKHPDMVLIDPNALATLPNEEKANGMAEIIKHGLIGDSALFDRLERAAPGDFLSIVDEAVRVKVGLVQEDPFEKGDRALLNLGHTFGHAFELLSDFQLKHGSSVAVGLVAAAKLAEELGKCDSTLVERIERTVNLHGLPKRIGGYNADEVIDAMKNDKKRDMGHLRFVVPITPGRAEIITHIPPETVRKAVKWVLSD